MPETPNSTQPEQPDRPRLEDPMHIGRIMPEVADDLGARAVPDEQREAPEPVLNLSTLEWSELMNEQANLLRRPTLTNAETSRLEEIHNMLSRVPQNPPNTAED